LRPTEISADVTTFVSGRRLDDNVQALIRFEGGAKGSLWSSQIAVGEENNLNIRIYGEIGSLAWSQENPNYVHHARMGEPAQTLTRGGPGNGVASTQSTRLPTGHPEGYFEAFAQLYRDFAELVRARLEEREPDEMALLLPTCGDGLQGVQFIDAVLQSARNNSVWTELP
jgi:predicted dehydrogenase